MLWTAEHLAALAAQVEQGSRAKSRAAWIEHRAYVLSSLTAASNFSEAFINELYQDVGDRVDGRMHPGDWLFRVTEPLPEGVMVRMLDYWRSTEGGRWGSTLEKCERLVEWCNGRLDDETRHDALLLARVRNAIVHFRPRDSFTAREAHTFETELKKRRIPSNPLAEGQPRGLLA